MACAQAGVLLNPVIDIGANYAGTDIPDWSVSLSR